QPVGSGRTHRSLPPPPWRRSYGARRTRASGGYPAIAGYDQRDRWVRLWSLAERIAHLGGCPAENQKYEVGQHNGNALSPAARGSALGRAAQAASFQTLMRSGSWRRASKRTADGALTAM